MKISYDWLSKFFFDTSRPKLEDVTHGLTFHAFEIDGVDKHTEDAVLDVKVTPNRGHDCLSHRGIAKEVAAIQNIALREDPLRQPVSLKPITDKVTITIQGDTLQRNPSDTQGNTSKGGVALSEESPLCSRYIAAYIRDVKVGPSPEWLKKNLEAVGQRSINNVVDATNYVMFNLGQPLHAFDAGKLSTPQGRSSVTKDGPRYAIEVRKARAGEKMVALDDKEYALTDTMLVIADANDDVLIGIAGVKGGEPAGITEKTTDIIIESANFDGASVRKAAHALKLRTDASSRFEQVLSPELAEHGIIEVVRLIRELAGGDFVGFAEQYPRPILPWSVSVTATHVNKLLGTRFSPEEIGKALNRLGLTHTVTEDDTFTVQVPFERLDIQIPEDLIEEVGRIIGYDKVPTTDLPPMQGAVAINRKFYWSERIRESLLSKGFSEVYTSVFTDKDPQFKQIAIANKIDPEKSYLRARLNTGLDEALERNVRNKELLGLDQVRLFEIGDVWQNNEESPVLGIAVESIKDAKTGDQFLTDLGQYLGTSKSLVGPGPVSNIVEIKIDNILGLLPHPSSYEELPISNTVRYQTFSKYPYIVRDIALWTPAGTSPDTVLKIIREHSGELLQRADLFDQFEKDGKVSFAFRLVFQSFDRTLFDNDANERMESIYIAVTEKGWEVR